jgi:hypothetical protein
MCARTIDVYEELLFPEAGRSSIRQEAPVAIPA